MVFCKRPEGDVFENSYLFKWLGMERSALTVLVYVVTCLGCVLGCAPELFLYNMSSIHKPETTIRWCGGLHLRSPYR